jgi:hypothetical protein
VKIHYLCELKEYYCLFGEHEHRQKTNYNSLLMVYKQARVYCLLSLYVSKKNPVSPRVFYLVDKQLESPWESTCDMCADIQLLIVHTSRVFTWLYSSQVAQCWWKFGWNQELYQIMQCYVTDTCIIGESCFGCFVIHAPLLVSICHEQQNKELWR